MGKLYEAIINGISEGVKAAMNEAKEQEHYIMVSPMKFTDFMYGVDNGEARNGYKLSTFILSEQLDWIIAHYPMVYGDRGENQFYVVYGNDVDAKYNIFSMKEFERAIKRSGIVRQFKSEKGEPLRLLAVCRAGIICMHEDGGITYWTLMATKQWFNKRRIFI